jgi:hypothetical protein
MWLSAEKMDVSMAFRRAYRAQEKDLITELDLDQRTTVNAVRTTMR